MKRGQRARRAMESPRPQRGQQEGRSTPLHEERLDAVVNQLVESGAVSVLDLGCGSGSLLRRLLEVQQFTRIVGIDSSFEALLLAERLRETAGEGTGERLALRHGSFTSADDGLIGFDAAAMVETIEHIAPAHLSRVERAVFAVMRPRLVVMTTPNREYNDLFGRAEKELRHADHRFEWSRSKYQAWATGVADRNGYRVEFGSIGPGNAWHGSPTQMGIFRLNAR